MTTTHSLPQDTHVRAIGLMSGTSMDGVDAAAIEIREGKSPLDPVQVTLRAFVTHQYPRGLRRELQNLCQGTDGSARAVCRLTMVVGEVFAQAALAVMQDAGWSPTSVSVIGSHGQTTVSDMSDGELDGFRTYSTLQLGNPAVIAERTGITVVSDFRSRDIAAGGRGAPLVPRIDALLYAHPAESRVLLNLGGIANVTFLPSQPGTSGYGEGAEIRGFDVGPANMPLDAVMRLSTDGQELYDRDGQHAARGRVDPTLLRELLDHPFLHREPPKATGSEEFGESFVSDLRARHPDVSRNDLLATLGEWTAAAVAGAIRRWFPGGESPAQMLVSGGGIHNQALMTALAHAVAPISLQPLEKVGGHSDAKEAVAFALLGYLTLNGWTGNVPSVTGASHAVLLGSITPGRPGVPFGVSR